MMMRPDGMPGSCVCKHQQSVPDDLPDTRSGGTTSNDTVMLITSLKNIIKEVEQHAITRNKTGTIRKLCEVNTLQRLDEAINTMFCLRTT